MQYVTLDPIARCPRLCNRQHIPFFIPTLSQFFYSKGKGQCPSLQRKLPSAGSQFVERMKPIARHRGASTILPQLAFSASFPLLCPCTRDMWLLSVSGGKETPLCSHAFVYLDSSRWNVFPHLFKEISSRLTFVTGASAGSKGREDPSQEFPAAVPSRCSIEVP